MLVRKLEEKMEKLREDELVLKSTPVLQVLLQLLLLVLLQVLLQVLLLVLLQVLQQTSCSGSELTLQFSSSRGCKNVFLERQRKH